MKVADLALVIPPPALRAVREHPPRPSIAWRFHVPVVRLFETDRGKMGGRIWRIC